MSVRINKFVGERVSIAKITRLEQLVNVMDSLSDKEFDRFIGFIESYSLLSPAEKDKVVWKKDHTNDIHISVCNQINDSSDNEYCKKEIHALKSQFGEKLSNMEQNTNSKNLKIVNIEQNLNVQNSKISSIEQNLSAQNSKIDNYNHPKRVLSSNDSCALNIQAPNKSWKNLIYSTTTGEICYL